MGSTVLIDMDTVKVEDEEDLVACRICLAWDLKMYNISESGLERALSELMGSSWSVWDGFPQHVCVMCRALLVKAQALRARCRRAEQLLKQAVGRQQIITNSYIRTIDRATYKLTYTLSKDCSRTSVQYYCEQDDTQTNATNKHPCDDVVKDEVEQEGNGNTTDGNAGDILQINIIEADTKEFDTNCDDRDHSDDETKSIIEACKYKIEIDNVEAKPALAEVKMVETNLDKQIKKVGLKRGRPKKESNKETLQQKLDAKQKKSKKKIGEKKKVKAKEVEEKDSEPGRFFTIEEIEEFIKKHNFEIQYLTDEEMAEDMERRKVSDRYKHCKYKCSLCYKGFLTTTTFDNHMKKDHDPRNAKNECRLCRVSYRYGFYLRQHVQNAHRLRLRCAECGEGVWGRKECVAHAARHAGATRQCKHCGKHFLKKSSYTWHMRAAHPVENAASGSCELCGEIYTSPKGLRAHKLLAHNKRSVPELQCPRCRAQFDDRDALRNHRRLQVDDKCDTNMSPCAACGLGCAGADALLRHLHLAHHRDIYTCDRCNKSFLSKSSLSTHIDRVHLGIKPLQHHQLTQYRKHSKRPVQHRKRDHDHMCEHCGKAYTHHQLTQYRKHSKRPAQHRKIDHDHMCEHCGKAYTHHQLTQYRKHSKRPAQHRKIDHDHMCEHCRKAYTTHQFLKNHQMSHTGERPYKCDRCPKGFTTAVQLTWHTRTHTGERPFQCDQCHQAFSLEGNLRRHRKAVHLGLRKNVPCPRCDKTFSTNSTLKLHIRTVHDGAPWPRRARRPRHDKPRAQPQGHTIS